ncbi:E3 SUMO-protein ligase ZBED1 isoform X1 [Microplitis demolitor]|uniref:E3 SUMO-protein ligase ZBED1 isoform X1 n=2 Tax=Microplitis demolitor TaxID=69319 RepID=UPI0004CD9585|nr:E3 SUMO-protein ligase ZBED1 isoform X1 [Microplitis demolitor]XP_008555278.1 E3 SUMO-protein ligase ZBED1 isoform X1 [Microplitis demolitor]
MAGVKPIISYEIMATDSERDENNEVHLAYNMMEEKHTYTYKKLVVPMSMRSVYWKYFGFPATDEGEILTKIKIVCILCRTQIAYNRNTSNLRMHLQNKHTHELMELEATKPPKKQYVPQDPKERRAQKKLLKSTTFIHTTNIDGTVHIDGDLQYVTDPNVSFASIEDDVSLESPLRISMKNASTSRDSQQLSYVISDDGDIQHAESRDVTNLLTELVVMDMQLPNFVEGSGFLRFMSLLGSSYEIPCRSKLETELIPKMYDRYKSHMLTVLHKIPTNIGLTLEEWKSSTDEYFITISMFYQNTDEPIMETRVLTTVNAPRDWDINQWGTFIEMFLYEWNLRSEKVTAIITATAREELLSALTNRGFTLIPCLLFTLQECVQECFDNPGIKEILAACRVIVGVITAKMGISEKLEEQDTYFEIEENPLTMDYPAVWTSTHNMMQQMIAKKSYIESLLVSKSESEGSEIGWTGIKFEAEHWSIIEDLVMVLEPLKVIILTLVEEKIPIISLLKPLLWQLESVHLGIKQSDSNLTKTFKTQISEKLLERYECVEISKMLQIATTLDPRFKQLPYAADEDKIIAMKEIKESIKTLIHEEERKPANRSQEPVNKKSRLSGMENLFKDFNSKKTRTTISDKAELEMVQYQGESGEPLGSCPIEWWTKLSAKCPFLYKLATHYNCVPVCCAPSTRIHPEAQIVYNIKRASIPSHLVDKLIFLNCNHGISFTV